MTTAQFTTPDAALMPLTIFYDHSCVLCRSEIENIAVRDLKGHLKMVDCSAKGFDTTGLPFNQTTLLASIHAVDAKGEWLRATDVFVACYRQAQMQHVARLFAFAKPLLERVYPWIARHRHLFSAIGVHKVFQYLTRRYVNRQAALAQANSMGCKTEDCEIKPR